MAKVLTILTILLFAAIGIAALVKTDRPSSINPSQVVEVQLEKEMRPIAQATVVSPPVTSQPKPQEIQEGSTPPSPPTPKPVEPPPPTPPPAPPAPSIVSKPRPSKDLPEGNRIEELFRVDGPKLPIVETITYQSRVSWHKGSPAWIGDYASHYATSKHFIARSLNGKVDYLKQDITDGKKFNIFKPNKPIHFYLVIDSSRCKMWFYVHDEETQERTLLKTYDVGLGRPEASKTSGMLTPLGEYTLGNRVAVYKPGVMGNYKGQKAEMVRIFGTRWIPFEKEVANTTAPAKGFGIHGVPWVQDASGKWKEDASSIGKYESDGCVRMATDDVEEIYAIVITKPTTVILVRDFFEAKLPGKEG